jgi:acetyl esterase/lipase
MSWLFLVVSLIGVWFTVNAHRPVRRNRLLFAPSFFAAWMTTELAGHHVFWQAVATVVFVAAGALESWPGWVALGLTLASWAGLAVLMVQGWRSARTMEECLGDLLPEEQVPGVPWSHVVLPFRMRRSGVRRIRNIEFARAGGRSLRLDVYQPEEPGERRPAILQVHGGAWTVGDKREQGIPLLQHLAASGWVGFNANYRLSPFATWPEHLIDLKRAVAWIREHADEYGVDPSFIAVTGGSAGGHLTAMLALTADDKSLQPGFEGADTSFQAAVPFYGVYDFTNRQGANHSDFVERFIGPWVLKAHFEDEPEKFHAASPVDRVHAGAPPFLVLHGDRDTLAPVEDARLFVERLREASEEPVVYVELHGAHHAFDLFVSARAKPVIESVERFLFAVRDRAQTIPEADILVEADDEVEVVKS